MRKGILASLTLFLAAGCSHPPPEDPGAAAAAVAEPPARVSVAPADAPLALTDPASPWRIFRNQPIGDDNVFALSFSQNLSLVVRQTVKKLECYVTTGDPLESTDNMPRNFSHVKYGFDQGEMAPGDWILSDRKTALFYPGDVRKFIRNFRKVRRFAIEYRASGKMDQTTSFNVSLFPYAVFDGLDNRESER